MSEVETLARILAGKCEHEGHELDCEGAVEWESGRTAYHTEARPGSIEDPNRRVLLCRLHAEMHHAHWNDMWAQDPRNEMKTKLSDKLRLCLEALEQGRTIKLGSGHTLAWSREHKSFGFAYTQYSTKTEKFSAGIMQIDSGVESCGLSGRELKTLTSV